MKLLDILAKELEEWPKIDGEDAACVAQDFDGSVFSYRNDISKYTYSDGTVEFETESESKHLFGSVLASDQKNAIITKEMWEEARARHIGEKNNYNCGGLVKDSKLDVISAILSPGMQMDINGYITPNIDTKCQFSYQSGTKRSCVIKDIGQKGVYLYEPDRDTGAKDYDCYNWYPKDQIEFFVESDRDREVNRMVMAACSGLTFNNEVKAYLKHMAEVLYDAGWRKTK